MNTEERIRQLEEEQKKLSKEMIIFAAHTEHLSHIRKDMNEMKLDVNELQVKNELHDKSNQDNFEHIFEWMKETDKKLNNHLVHIAADIADLKNLKKFFWILIGSSAAVIIGSFYSLILK